MIFVPLALFATFLLGFVLVRFVAARDMTLTPHRFFAALIATYMLQSLLVSLRWGYGIDAAAPLAALLAPVLPVLAHLAYRSLSGAALRPRGWPVAVLAANWLAYAIAPDISDVVLIATYLGFGALLLARAAQGADRLALSPFGDSALVLRAMRLTGLALIGAGLTDIYLIYDFITTQGQTVGRVVTLTQTGFALVIGLASSLGRAAEDTAPEATAPPDSDTAEEDSAIVARIEQLFHSEGLHRREDLTLRKLSRRLGLPDRRVSNAINRQHGGNISQFVNGFRIREACDLLLRDEDTILGISLAVGFASKSNFNREFVRVTGQTPSRWRAAQGLG